MTKEGGVDELRGGNEEECGLLELQMSRSASLTSGLTAALTGSVCIAPQAPAPHYLIYLTAGEVGPTVPVSQAGSRGDNQFALYP